MSRAKRHDPINEGMWMAAIVAGIVAWLYFRASPELPAAAGWWRIYNGSFVEWLPGYCPPTRTGAAVTLGVGLMIPLLFAGIRFSEWLHISSLRSQKRRAQRVSALVENRKPPVQGRSTIDRPEAGEIQKAHGVFLRERRPKT
ncbi:hypothetical protein [Haloferula sargassicola]|uniref:Uncharacterized protein n=1 Tax=Haloferula sargassicola TaxID=490096 RepID=A0ABP9UR41_9BACT